HDQGPRRPADGARQGLARRQPGGRRLRRRDGRDRRRPAAGQEHGMTGDMTAPGSEAADPSASPQEISGVFRGSADGATAPRERDERSVVGEKSDAGEQTDARKADAAKKTQQGISARAIPTFVAGEELADLADSDARIVVLTADLAGAGRTIDFANRHPGRFFNIGVAEQNMVSVAAGMASTGLRPFISTFAAYLALLCCEHLTTHP